MGERLRLRHGSNRPDAYADADSPRLLPALHYIGRPASASTATGSYRIHKAEEKALLQAVFETPKRDRHATRRPVVVEDDEDAEDEGRVSIGYAGF